MRADQLIRRITAAALLPLLVLVGLSTARAYYRCAADRVLRVSCCCPKAVQEREAATSPGPLVKRVFCCTLERTAAVQAPSAQVADRADAAAATASLAPLVAVAIVPALLDSPAVARLPRPRLGPEPPPTTRSLLGQRIAFLV